MPSIDGLKSLLALACKSTYLKWHITPVLSQDAGTHPHKHLLKQAAVRAERRAELRVHPGPLPF